MIFLHLLYLLAASSFIVSVNGSTKEVKEIDVYPAFQPLFGKQDDQKQQDQAEEDLFRHYAAFSVHSEPWLRSESNIWHEPFVDQKPYNPITPPHFEDKIEYLTYFSLEFGKEKKNENHVDFTFFPEQTYPDYNSINQARDEIVGDGYQPSFVENIPLHLGFRETKVEDKKNFSGQFTPLKRSQSLRLPKSLRHKKFSQMKPKKSCVASAIATNLDFKRMETIKELWKGSVENDPNPINSFILARMVTKLLKRAENVVFWLDFVLKNCPREIFAEALKASRFTGDKLLKVGIRNAKNVDFEAIRSTIYEISSEYVRPEDFSDEPWRGPCHFADQASRLWIPTAVFNKHLNACNDRQWGWMMQMGLDSHRIGAIEKGTIIIHRARVLKGLKDTFSRTKRLLASFKNRNGIKNTELKIIQLFKSLRGYPGLQADFILSIRPTLPDTYFGGIEPFYIKRSFSVPLKTDEDNQELSFPHALYILRNLRPHCTPEALLRIQCALNSISDERTELLRVFLSSHLPNDDRKSPLRLMRHRLFYERSEQNATNVLAPIVENEKDEENKSNKSSESFFLSNQKVYMDYILPLLRTHTSLNMPKSIDEIVETAVHPDFKQTAIQLVSCFNKPFLDAVCTKNYQLIDDIFKQRPKSISHQTYSSALVHVAKTGNDQLFEWILSEAPLSSVSLSIKMTFNNTPLCARNDTRSLIFTAILRLCAIQSTSIDFLHARLKQASLLETLPENIMAEVLYKRYYKTPLEIDESIWSRCNLRCIYKLEAFSNGKLNWQNILVHRIANLTV